MQNGLGVAGLVCGIVGAVFGIIPFTFWLGFVLGVIAIVFGAIGRKRAARGEASNRGQATAGLVLGITAVVLAIVGFIILVSLVSDSSNNSCFDQPTSQSFNCGD